MDGTEQKWTHAVLGTPLGMPLGPGQEEAVFAMGCFWGAEKGFWRLPGVVCTAAGYAGGTAERPTYEQVCSGSTGHAEAVRVTFDPEKITFADLARWFWQSHDPTQVNGQGNDRGPQYRSALYYTTDEQCAVAHATLWAFERALRASGRAMQTIATEVRALKQTAFYHAEAAHQQYLARPGAQPYCSSRPLMIPLPPYRLDAHASLSEADRHRLGPRLPEAFWAAHAPTYQCALSLPNEPIEWSPEADAARDDEVEWATVEVGTALVRGDDALMSRKAHGSSAYPVQAQLRWGCDAELADRICCFNRRFAEPRGYWQLTRLAAALRDAVATPPHGEGGALTFFDSVSARPLFQLPLTSADGSLAEFEEASTTHGWPSFREGQVDWRHVRVLSDGEVGERVHVHAHMHARPL